MTSAELAALTPFFVLGGGLLLLLLVVSFWRRHEVALITTLVVLVATFVSLSTADSIGSETIDGMLVIDEFSRFFSGLFLFATVVTAILARAYFETRARHAEEFYILLVTSAFGAMTMASANHFATFILGLEIISISLYAMVAYPDEGRPPLEAAAKYLILSGVGTTTLLFGMALSYAGTGTLEFSDLFAATGTGGIYTVIGQAMIIIGVGFKLSLVPFHMWTPDVYQGAPLPVAAFLATVSKGAVAALLFRYAIGSEFLSHDVLYGVVALMAIASMVLGNILALLQDNLKRLLAYSSIAHFGYLMIAFLVIDQVAMGVETAMVYMVGYFLMTLAAFGVMTVMSTGDRDAEDLSDYEGLFWRRPVLAAVLTTAALSLAGIPLTVGFIAKFYLFAAGVTGATWVLLWALVIGSAIGVYYYVRIVFSMTKRPEDEQGAQAAAPVSWESLATVVVLGVAVVAFGVYPTPLIEAVQQVVAFLGV